MRPKPSLAVATEFPEFDILENASVMMPCGSCGEYYPVTLREILLAEESALRDLVRSWTRVMRQVEAAGFDLTFRRPLLRH